MPMTSLPFGMGLPKLPCCPRAGAKPPPEISPGAWSPGTEPSALEVWGGKWGAQNSVVQVAARFQNILALLTCK